MTTDGGAHCVPIQAPVVTPAMAIDALTLGPADSQHACN